MLSRTVVRKQRGRRGLTALAAVGLVSSLLFVGGSALAVHDINEFELDKDATGDTNYSQLALLGKNINGTVTAIPVCQLATTDPVDGDIILIEAERMTIASVATGTWGGNCAAGTTKKSYTVDARTGGVAHAANGVGALVSLVNEYDPDPEDGPDWDQVYASITADADSEGDDDKCISLGLFECTFISDQIGPSIYTQGSTKDHLPIEGWFHTTGGSPDKGEILNAFAAKAIDDDGDEIVYFGMDRWAVDGSTDIGFWFFKNQIVACGDPTNSPAQAAVCTEAGVPNGEFAGSHEEGDLLALATFTQGGAETTIRVFRWVDGGGNEQENIDGPEADGTDCFPDEGPLTGDELCGTVNNTTIEVPWTYTFKGAAVGGWVPTGGVFEGGLNLTESGLEGCFASFLAETRASPELTAILKDFALGEFEACDTELTTTPADGSGEALSDGPDQGSLPDTTIGTGASGVDVTDIAEIDVKGTSDWSGTLDFYLCGPIASGTCEEGGVPILPSVDVSDEDGTTYTSASANITEVGRYCWRGEFISDTDVPSDTDASEGECFEVLPVQPALSTQAIAPPLSAPVSGPVDFGDPVYDKATLVGTAYQKGTNGDGDANGDYTSINADMVTPANGTITFTLVGPDGEDPDCTTVATAKSGTTGDNPETVDVSGDGDYFTSGFTPDAPGDYHWKAVYSGDSPNTLGTSHNDECTDADEDVTVEQIPTQIATRQRVYPNDSARISSTVSGDNIPAGGTVTFRLYQAGGGNTAAENCGAHGTTLGEGGLIYVESLTTVGGADFEVLATDNTTVPVTASGSYYWWVTYDTGDDAHTGSQSDCTENVVLTFTNDSGPGTLYTPPSS